MKRPLLLFLALLAFSALASGQGRIQFDRQRYAVSAGESVEIGYTLSKEGKLNVRTSGGWTAEVTPVGGRKGTIKITASDPATEPDIMAFAVIPGEDDALARLNVMVKDPYTAATRPRANLQVWGGLDRVNTNQEDYQKVADAGFTVITLEGGEALDMDGDGSLTEEDMLATMRYKLELIKNAGLKFTLHHPQLPGVIDMVKDDPDLMMVHIFDEPGLNKIPMLKQRRDWVKSVAPDVPVHINLHPHASIRALGTDYYRDYVQKLVDGTGMDILSYDQYPVLLDGSVMNDWYRCLEVNSGIARAKGMPFWAFTASCGMDYEQPARQKPTMENLRLQVYTDLAYGAQVVQYFVYRSYAVASIAPLTPDGKYTWVYDLVKEFNAEVHKRGYLFCDSKVSKTCFTHLTPQGCLPLVKSDLPEEIASLETSRTALVSFFENQGGKYIAVVNSSCKENFALDIEFTDLAYTIDRSGEYTEQQPGKTHFIIDDGDMLVIKYR